MGREGGGPEGEAETPVLGTGSPFVGVRGVRVLVRARACAHACTPGISPAQGSPRLQPEQC